MFDIRKICNGATDVHSRYMADTNGCIYVNYGQNCFRVVTKSGERKSIMGKKKSILRDMAKSGDILKQIEDTSNYFIMQDGSILKRLSTRYIKEKNRVDVSINRVYGRERGDRMYVHRAVAGAFLGNIDSKEVHHIDGNPMNNRLENLMLVTREEHLSLHEKCRD